MDSQAAQASKTATDLSRMQTQRVDDIMQLKSIIKAQAPQVSLLMDIKADSYAHCEQIMEEEVDYIDRSSSILSQ